jgi:3D (Asp-Asp-Asp) domain-containing protein
MNNVTKIQQNDAKNVNENIQVSIENVTEEPEWVDVKVTAYDLSVRSCGKRKSHKEYGISRSGFNLKGHTRESAMSIAVDPKVIPLGSIVRIEFYNEEYQKYNGEYTARDTGRLIKGNKIDLFMGDFGDNNCTVALEFGITEAKITIIKNEEENF